MKSIPVEYTPSNMESLMAVCCGNPHEDELPQVAGETDILMDVCGEILNMPRESASARFHHQFDDAFDYDDVMH